MKNRTRCRCVAAAVLVLCCALASCGARRASLPAAGPAAGGPSVTDGTADDQRLPDATADDRQDPGPHMGDTVDDGGGVPTAGPHRWFPMLREFRAYLTADAPKADARIAGHVTGVYVRTPAGGDRTTSPGRA